MQNLQLNMVTAVILIDNESNRIMAKYFHPEHADPKNPASHAKQPFATLKEQRVFEAAIWEKTRKQTGTPVPVRVHLRLPTDPVLLSPHQPTRRHPPVRQQPRPVQAGR